MMMSLDQYIFKHEWTHAPTQVRVGGGGAAHLWLEGINILFYIYISWCREARADLKQ